jgi:hypothetical protein
MSSGNGIHEMLFFPDSPMQLSRFFAELLRSPAFSDFLKQTRKKQKRLESSNLTTSLTSCAKLTQRKRDQIPSRSHTHTWIAPGMFRVLMLLDGG